MAAGSFPSIDQAVSQALKDAPGKVKPEDQNIQDSDNNEDPGDSGDPEDADSDPNEDLGDEDPKENDNSDDSSSDELTTNEAVALYNLLKDPKTGKQTIAELAEFFGVKIAEALPEKATKTEVKEETAKVKKAIDEILQAELGDEYVALPRGFGPALEKIIREFAEESVAPLKAELAKREETEIRTAAQTAYSEAEKLPNFTKNNSRIRELSQEYPFNGTPTKENYYKHLRRLNTIANDEAGDNTSALEEKKRSRISKNLGERGTKFDAKGESSPPPRPTLDQAVRLALKQYK